jgi:HEAT repeat protein
VELLFPLGCQTTLVCPSMALAKSGFISLAAFWSEARPATPALLELLQDPDYSLRQAAVDALKRINPEAGAGAEVK